MQSCAIRVLGTNCFSGGDDFYWLSRDSALLIRGGANYSHEQINSELTLWAQARLASTWKQLTY